MKSRRQRFEEWCEKQTYQDPDSPESVTAARSALWDGLCYGFSQENDDPMPLEIAREALDTYRRFCTQTGDRHEFFSSYSKEQLREFYSCAGEGLAVIILQVLQDHATGEDYGRNPY